MKRVQESLVWPRSLLSRLVLVCLFLPCSARAAEPDWPRIASQQKPWTRFWWLGNIGTDKDLSSEMERYAKAGLGGLELTPIYGVKGYEDRFVRYLSPDWMRRLEHILKVGARLGLGIDMATGNGWPFGGPWVTAGDACKYMVSKTYTLRAGARLSEPVVFRQPPLVRAIGRRVDISELKEPVAENNNLQALALEQVRFPKALPLQLLMAYSNRGETLDLTAKVGPEGKLDWVAPAGDWSLYAIFQGWHGKMVERAGPGAEGDVIDHFSAQALQNYLKRFDQAFAGHDVGLLRAFFNDSYEVDDAAGESNWTPRYFEEFERRRGYDLKNHLPALLGRDTPEKNSAVITDYRETISDLLLEEFTTTWQRWAAGRGAMVRNQAHGSPANILDLYGASDIPETEGADILRMKFASSAAHVTGKPLASAEAATWLNEHFLATLAEVKQAVDRFFLGGINHVFYHGTAFSPPGEPWPGFHFYASVELNPSNSFWNDFAALNDYVARCQSFLQSGRPANDVLVYYPIHDRWAQPANTMLQHFSGPDGTAARAVAQALLDAGFTFDFISDRQMAGVKPAGGGLQSRGATYRAVVVPECRTIPPATMEKLVEVARQGAAVIVLNRLPADVPGWGNLEARRRTLGRALAQIGFGPADARGVQVAAVGKGRFLLGGNVGQLLARAGVGREPMVDHNLRFERRSHGAGYVYFILNSGGAPLDGWVPLRHRAGSAAIFDPMFRRSGLAAIRVSAGGTAEIYLQLQAGESCIVKTFDSRVNAPLFAYWKVNGEPRPVAGSWSIRFTEGGPGLPAPIQLDELRSWTAFGGDAGRSFSGSATYTIRLARPAGEADGWRLDLGRVCDSARVKLNGQELGALISAPYRTVIPKQLLRDENNLEVTVSNLMANRIADLDRRNVNWRKFYNVNFPARRRENAGPDGLFTASKWPPRDSGLLGPVTLTPLESAVPAR